MGIDNRNIIELKHIIEQKILAWEYLLQTREK